MTASLKQVLYDSLSPKELNTEAKSLKKLVKKKSEQLEKYIDPLLETTDINQLAAINQFIWRRHSSFQFFRIETIIHMLAEEQKITKKEVDTIVDKPLEKMLTFLPKDFQRKRISSLCDSIQDLKINLLKIQSVLWFQHFKKFAEEKNTDEIEKFINPFSSENIHFLYNQMQDLILALEENDLEDYQNEFSMINNFYNRFR